ncbi:hypothetical protein [Solilutibacter pythonis]|uniref:hypothetical protein n=1 Tax=Solilutibacter pythonis TaxID=2483112 RepID=UPI0011C36B48|nr:hypothetical protein [Lysobacter pythonis]
MSTQRLPVRWLQPGETPPSTVAYWRGRTHSERLAAVLQLHREGNALFKGGNPPFRFELRFSDDRTQ